MRSLKVNLILWLLIALTFESLAQGHFLDPLKLTPPGVYGPYTFLLKGQASAYDSGVVVEIHQYRKETKKLAIADQLVFNFDIERSLWSTERVKSDSIIADLSYANTLLIRSNERKDTTIAALDKNFMRLKGEAVELNKKYWFEDWRVIVPGGVLLGMVIQGLISK